MSYKNRSNSFNHGGAKQRLHRVLTVIGSDDLAQSTRKKKLTPIGYQ